MWLKVEAPNYYVVNTNSLDTIYVKYKGHSQWSVTGTIKDRDIHIQTCVSEKDAESYVIDLMGQID